MVPSATVNAWSSDPICAQFADGTLIRINDVKVHMWAAMNERAMANGVDPLWQGEVARSHHKLHLSQRSDRNLLLAIYEQGNQRLQIRVDKFGPLPNNDGTVLPNDNPTVQLAAEFGTTPKTYHLISTNRRLSFEIKFD